MESKLKRFQNCLLNRLCYTASGSTPVLSFCKLLTFKYMYGKL